MFPVIHILGRDLGTYSICAIIGLAVCAAVSTLIGKKRGFKFEDIILFMLVIGAGILVGGHIMYGITNIRSIVTILGYIGRAPFITLVQYLAQSFGGMVYYGGFIGACIAAVIYSKFSKNFTRGELLDLFAVNAPLFHFFGRLGCFFGGCCYGIESEFGFLITDNTVNPGINGVRRLPTALIEAFFNLVIFLILLYIYKKKKFHGEIIFIYMLIYPVVRFVIEFFRGDEVRGFLLGLSTSQWISIILFIIAAAHFTAKKLRSKNHTQAL